MVNFLQSKILFTCHESGVCVLITKNSHLILRTKDVTCTQVKICENLDYCINFQWSSFQQNFYQLGPDLDCTLCEPK